MNFISLIVISLLFGCASSNLDGRSGSSPLNSGTSSGGGEEWKWRFKRVPLLTAWHGPLTPNLDFTRKVAFDLSHLVAAKNLRLAV